MNKKSALSILEENLLGENSIPVKIRLGEGINEDDYTQLKSAINFLISYYKEKSKIPKIVSLAFLDISNHFFLKESNYSEDEIEKIEDIGIELTELGNALFS